MPLSNTAAKKATFKKNRELGIGNAEGKIVRVKDEKPSGQCTVCKMDFTFTKTNSEAKDHAAGKHADKTFADCFPTADAVAAELNAVATAAKTKKGLGNKAGEAGGKAAKKAKEAAELGSLLSAGLTAAPKKK